MVVLDNPLFPAPLHPPPAGRGPNLNFNSQTFNSDPDEASRGGWAFTDEAPDPVFGVNDLREVYETCSPGFKGRYALLRTGDCVAMEHGRAVVVSAAQKAAGDYDCDSSVVSLGCTLLLSAPSISMSWDTRWRVSLGGYH